MHHHAGGLINHHHVVILVENFEREFLRLGMERRKIGGRKRDGIARAQQMGGARRRGVHLHAILLDPGLQSRAAVFGQTFMEERIETLARIAGFRR
jgi:dihydropteroate synthase